MFNNTSISIDGDLLDDQLNFIEQVKIIRPEDDGALLLNNVEVHAGYTIRIQQEDYLLTGISMIDPDDHINKTRRVYWVKR